MLYRVFWSKSTLVASRDLIAISPFNVITSTLSTCSIHIRIPLLILFGPKRMATCLGHPQIKVPCGMWLLKVNATHSAHVNVFIRIY